MKKQNISLSEKATFTDLELKERIKHKTKPIIGTFLIILSGIVLYMDKIFVYLDIQLDNLYGWNNTETFVWVVCQSLSPLILLIAAYFRPYLFSFIVPGFAYALQLAYVFNPDLVVEDSLNWVYLVSSVSLIMVTIYAVRKRSDDLDMLKNIEYHNLIEENKKLKSELEKIKKAA